MFRRSAVLNSLKHYRNMTTSYENIIIGSGQSGTPLAVAFAKAGQKTALIEREHIGGSCINEGCTPTKTLIASGRVGYLVRKGPDYGIHTHPPEHKTHVNMAVVDMLKVRQRKRDIVASFRGGSETKLKDAGVDTLVGEATFVDEKTVQYKDSGGKVRNVQGQKIFINTGTRPASPFLEGVAFLDQKIVLNSTSIQELDVVPGHLVVLGGGYIGVEFAQLFSRLGAKVTIIQHGKQLLPREDKEMAQILRDIFQEDGLAVHLNSDPVRIAPSSDGFTLHYYNNDNDQTIEGTHILFATGRFPNTDMLNLEAAGINTDKKGYIVTNEYLETSCFSVFAMGDVKGPPAFTHISYDDFRIFRSNILPSSPPAMKLSIRDRLVPYVVFTDPQLAHVGLHEGEARTKFPSKNIQTAKMPMAYVARALEMGESRGMMKAVVDGDSGLILGFTCLGIEGGEIMSTVEIAMIGDVPYQKLRDAVLAHPTLAESLNNIWGFLE